MLSHFHTSPPAVHGFTLIEILITTGLATALIIAATTMLNHTVTTVEDNLQQDLDAKFTGAFATNFKRLSSRARMAAYFWHQPVDLSRSCFSDQGGGCGFILKANPKYDPSDPHSQKTCIDNIPAGSFSLNPPKIQFFANKQTTLSEFEITLSKSLDSKPQISHFAQLSTQKINQAPQNLYVAWRITPNQPLTMITRPYHKHAFLTLPHKFRSDAIHPTLKQIDSSQNIPLILEASPRAARLLKAPTDRAKLIGTVGVAYSINQPSIFSLFIINNILPFEKKSAEEFTEAWNAMIDEDIAKNLGDQRTSTINSIKSALIPSTPTPTPSSSNLYLFKLTALDQSAIANFIGSSTLAQIYLQPMKNYTRFHLANIKLNKTINIDLADSPPNEAFQWHHNIHRLDAVLKKNNNGDRLVFQPLALIKLAVHERKFLAPGIVSGDDDNNHCDTCVIKSLQRHAFKQQQAGDEPISTTSRPLLSGIKPKIKKTQGERKTAQNKEVIIARKLTSSSLVTIIGAPEDLRCPNPD